MDGIMSWKGDYLNLGAGAETGYYFGLPFIGKSHMSSGYFLGDKGKFPMSLDLYNTKTGDLVFHRASNQIEQQHWTTGFFPLYQKPVPEDLRAVTTIDLSSDVDVYEAFKKEWGSRAEENGLFFDDETFEVIITL